MGQVLKWIAGRLQVFCTGFACAAACLMLAAMLSGHSLDGASVTALEVAQEP